MPSIRLFLSANLHIKKLGRRVVTHTDAQTQRDDCPGNDTGTTDYANGSAINLTFNGIGSRTIRSFVVCVSLSPTPSLSPISLSLFVLRRRYHEGSGFIRACGQINVLLIM
uniref:Fimbrial protein n=1 Tax=Ascaris lumbricoides TaxID=6252 RepID=A0A0M3INE1_ASCLU